MKITFSDKSKVMVYVNTGRHMTFKQRRINVGAISWRCIDVDCPLNKIRIRSQQSRKFINPERLLWYMDLISCLPRLHWSAASENVPTDMYVQRRLESACASAQSDSNLRCPHEMTLHP